MTTIPRSTDPQPVLLFGMTPRSGTNYLYRLLRDHPRLHCVSGPQMPEDFLVYHSDLLIRYADVVSLWWSSFWPSTRDEGRSVEARVATRSRLAAALGHGLLTSLADPLTPGAMVVTKTPHVRNLANVFELFPDARVLLLVRDGRDQTESAVRSFGDPYELAMQRWSEAARTVIDFDRKHREERPRRHVVLRYEDLLAETRTRLAEVFDFLDVPVEEYEFAAAEQVPVLGSSQHLEAGERLSTGYRQVRPSAGFDPLGRWRTWPSARLARFNHVAGQEMRQLGYGLEGPVQDSVWQRARSLPYRARKAVSGGLSATERSLADVRYFGRRWRQSPLSR